MNRSKRDAVILGLRDDEDDYEERLYERQALISDDGQEFFDQDISSTSNGPINRLRRPKHSSAFNRGNRYELNSIKLKETREPNTEFVHYEIQPGETLQSICLRYACPLNQVKRMNGLINDQEFYGLRKLKLPLGKLGLLEEVIKQQQDSSQTDLMHMRQINNNDGTLSPESPQRFVNSPGSALSVTRFKSLLSPGYSSDNIARLSANNITNELSYQDNLKLQHNSHSFSSLSEFTRTNDKNSHSSPSNFNHPQTSRDLIHKSFIKTEVEDPNSNIDTLLTVSEPIVPNVFEDLDYHVGQAKAAAENYDKRAADIVDRIDISNSGQAQDSSYRDRGIRVSKIPELFFSGENFGLNITKLILLIVFICLIVPFVYMNQVNVFKKQL